MSKNTPGPWQIVGEDDLPDHDDLMIVAFDVTAPGEDTDGLFICNIGSNGGEFGVTAPVAAGDRWPVSLANARLIAAAPEMYELLDRIAGLESDEDYEPLSVDACKLLDKIDGK